MANAKSKVSAEALRERFRGELIDREHAHYDAARRIWNASIDKRPALVARCTGVADVIAAVRFAREQGLLVAIRGGGHNVAGRALCDDGIVIDLSPMKGVRVDAAARSVWAQAGLTLGELDRETHEYGLAVPLGVVSKTGIAGLTLGGGVGWLVRKYGMTCDNVLAFELVNAEGELLRASAESHPDLYWALRGGGGNFGVVTAFEYRAHPVHTVLGGLLIHPRERAKDLLRFYRDFTAKAPEELTIYAALLHAPDGAPIIALALCYCGDLKEGERVLKPVRAFGPPLVDAVQPLPMPVMQSLLDAGFPDGTQNYWKSALLPKLDDGAIDAIVDAANRTPSPLTAIVIEMYGGASTREPAGGTAFGHRAPAFDVGILTQWTDPADSPRNVAWTRELAAALKPHASGNYLLNFVGDEDEATIRAAFGKNYERLVEVKTKYDPRNFFRVNQNVRPRG